MAKVHVIPHTHWDREWYFTQQDSDVLATYNFTKVIETLENQASYTCYHLDGQSAIVEDYLKVLPHMRERMGKLVADKRLFIGPWYTQTDTYNVAGESIIRNLKYGMHIAEQLGHSMQVAICRIPLVTMHRCRPYSKGRASTTSSSGVALIMISR